MSDERECIRNLVGKHPGIPSCCKNGRYVELVQRYWTFGFHCQRIKLVIWDLKLIYEFNRHTSQYYRIIWLHCPVWLIYIVAVGEDHRGGTVSQKSDVTDTALGRKGTAMYRRVTCQPIVGLRNRALLGSRPLNASRPNTRCAAVGEAVSSPCPAVPCRAVRAEPHRALLHSRPRWRHTASRSFPRKRRVNTVTWRYTALTLLVAAVKLVRLRVYKRNWNV
jgi:hypothetical protein